MKSIHLFFILLGCFFIHFSTIFAQSQITASTSIPFSNPEQPPLIVRLPQGGLLAFVGSQGSNNLPEATIIKYDTLLQKVWEKTYPISYQLAAQPNGFTAEKLYFYFGRTDSTLQVAAIDLSNGNLSQIDCPNLLGKDFEIKHFSTLPNVLLFTKAKKNLNSILHFDIATQKAKILSNTNFIKADFVEMKTDQPSGTFGVLMKQSDSFWFYLYDRQGNILFDENITPDNTAHQFITHRSFMKDKNEQWVTGLFGKSHVKPQGVYVSRFINQKYEGTAYYPFSKMANFNKHLPQEEQDKIAAQIEKKGDYAYSYFFTKDYLQAIDSKVIHSTELYQDRNSIKKSHKISAICVFDKSGKLLWDNAFDYKNLKNNEFFTGKAKFDSASMVRKNMVGRQLPSLHDTPDHMTSSTSIIPAQSMSSSFRKILLNPITLGIKNERLSAANLTVEKFYFTQTEGNKVFSDVEISDTPFPNASMDKIQLIHWHEDSFLMMGVVNGSNGMELKLLKVK